MSIYDIDYNVFIKILVPRQLRNTKMLAWLNILVSPVVYIYDLFMTSRYTTDYILAHPPQVCFIQAVLNDAFDDALRRISIVDGPDEEPVYIYQIAETKPLPLYQITEASPITLYTDYEILGQGPDIVVEVPTILKSLPGWNKDYFDALVAQFALAGKSHVILFT